MLGAKRRRVRRFGGGREKSWNSLCGTDLSANNMESVDSTGAGWKLGAWNQDSGSRVQVRHTGEAIAIPERCLM
jgi:hypothetical protein